MSENANASRDKDPNSEVLESLDSTILPSYQLYSSTIVKNFIPLEEDLAIEPPGYGSITENESSTEQVSSFSATDLSRTQNSSPSFVPAEANFWENSILANSNKLKNVALINPTAREKIKVEIHISSQNCRRASFVPLNPRTYEFSPGDQLHGYFTIRNISDKPFPFDMLSVVFEGKVVIQSFKSPVYYKFLNLYDFEASWSPCNLRCDSDRDIFIDERDDTHLVFNYEKVLVPGVTYKKFFNFKIPDRLLECVCSKHYLVNHCDLIPTSGVSRDEFLNNLRYFRGLKKKEIERLHVERDKSKESGQEFPMRLVKDFSFHDTSVSYGIAIRVIGKMSNFNPNQNKENKPLEMEDEFILIREDMHPIRVIPRINLNKTNFPYNTIAASLSYNRILQKVQNKLVLGRGILKNQRGNCNDDQKMVDPKSSGSKEKNLFRSEFSPPDKLNEEECYSLESPYRGWGLGIRPPGSHIYLQTPKMSYSIPYLPPDPFNNGTKVSRDISIPIFLKFRTTEGCTPPDISRITAEMIVVSVRSKGLNIPIDLYPDLFFTNEGHSDDIHSRVINPFKLYVNDLRELVRKLPSDVFSVEKDLYDDANCIANLDVKYDILEMSRSVISSTIDVAEWEKVYSNSGKNGHAEFQKEGVINFDLNSFLNSKCTNSSCTLIPNFQSCYISRLYFLCFKIILPRREMSMKVPIIIH